MAASNPADAFPPSPSISPSLSPTHTPRSNSSGSNRSLLPKHYHTATPVSLTTIIPPTAADAAADDDVDRLSRFVGTGMLTACRRGRLPHHASGASAPENESASNNDDIVARTEREEGQAGILVLSLAAVTDEDGEDGMRRRRRSRRGSDERSGGEGLAALRGSSNDAVDTGEVEGEELAIRDLVPSAFGDDNGKGTIVGASGSGAGWLLAVKIAGAAATMGCALEDVIKVAGLVGANVRTVVNTSSNTSGPDHVDDEHGPEPGSVLESVIGRMLGRLLKPDGVGTMAPPLRVNSNEPVFLVNVWGGYVRSEVALLLSQTVGQLHAEYGIRPVRVYAGDYLLAANKEEKGFSISILNVVNTEIGGPSMIQLLDAPTRAPGWAVGVTKEEWEGREWSVAGTVDLGMRNWDRTGELWSGAKIERNEKAEEGMKGVDMESIEAVDREARKEGILSGVGRQHVKTAGSVDAKEDENSAEEEEGSEPKPIPETPRREAKDQHEPSDMDLSKNEEAEAESKKAADTKDTNANTVENEREEALNRDVGNDEENAKTPERKGVGDGKTSSEEYFEMVDREPTLIDIVFGRGQRQ